VASGECGQKSQIKGDSMRTLALVVSIIAASISACSTEDIPLADRYPAPWRTDFDLGISRAFVANNIRDCGEYRFRSSSVNSGEYLVRCTRDGANWSSYLVWVNLERVQGPFRPDSSLDDGL